MQIVFQIAASRFWTKWLLAPKDVKNMNQYALKEMRTEAYLRIYHYPKDVKNMKQYALKKWGLKRISVLLWLVKSCDFQMSKYPNQGDWKLNPWVTKLCRQNPLNFFQRKMKKSKKTLCWNDYRKMPPMSNNISVSVLAHFSSKPQEKFSTVFILKIFPLSINNNSSEPMETQTRSTCLLWHNQVFLHIC